MYSSMISRHLATIFLVPIAFILQSCNAVSTLRVNTTVGTVYGLINGTTPDVAQFLGVPFAEPPIQERRWLPAIPKSPVGDIDATEFGPSCPQYESAYQSVYSVDGREFLISGPTSEDCLTLNIWAPVTSPGNLTEKLPVLVWIYGGGYQTGGGEIGYQIPSQWIQRSQKHIFVGINYRLNLFGFPNAAGLKQSEQNLAFLDQRLGLEWVRSNIANFGGNVSRITLMGQSAGAWSTDIYNFAYPEDPIIAGIILDSGSAIGSSQTYDNSHSNFTFIASQFGCGNLSAEAELTCMRNVSSVDLVNFLKSYGDSGSSPSIGFNPVVENTTRFDNYTARALAKNFTDVTAQPAIIGTNDNEGSSLTSWILNGTTVNTTNADAVTAQYICRAVQTTQNRYAVNTTTFRYYYRGNFSNISPRPWEGAYHSSELPLIFGTHNIAREKSSPFEVAVSHRMQDLYLAFIRDPLNGLPAEGWQAYRPGGSTLEIAKDGVITQNVPNDEFESICIGEGNPVDGAVPP
ncbi:chlorogenic acid esterase precursor [Phlyctema vagabunda]|uniref:Carboxylic ester hydrolase n=1 Tax=Phlyctema vagabunda TaxID=108571 RepID=A0ABR4PFN2_9HELO